MINDTLGGGILRSKTEFPRVQRAMSGLPLSMAVWPRTNLEVVNHLCMFLKTDTPIWSDYKQDLGILFSNLFVFVFFFYKLIIQTKLGNEVETILEIYFRIFYLMKKIIFQSKQSSKVQLSGNNLEHLGETFYIKYTSIRVSTFWSRKNMILRHDYHSLINSI